MNGLMMFVINKFVLHNSSKDTLDAIILSRMNAVLILGLANISFRGILADFFVNMSLVSCLPR